MRRRPPEVCIGMLAVCTSASILFSQVVRGAFDVFSNDVVVETTN